MRRFTLVTIVLVLIALVIGGVIAWQQLQDARNRSRSVPSPSAPID
ncbi:MAG: hypothetical protein ACRDH6_10135 [Actinomycetota bacterium]